MLDNVPEFSKRNRRAIIIFLVLVTFIVFIPRIYSFFIHTEEYRIEQESFSSFEFKNKNPFNAKRSRKFHKKFKIPPKSFNPNNYSQNDWINLGLSEKQALWVVKYAKYGFYSDEDLRKCFVISDEFFNIIKDSIIYPIKEVKLSNKKETFTKSKFDKIIIELNSCSEEDLLKIKGIGQFFAKNIIKRRDALGGFVNKNQLLEVWKFDENKLKEIEDYIKIDPEKITQIGINSISIDELKKHPYFSWNIANSVVKLRQQIGAYQKVDDLKRSILIDNVLYEKIKPYIKID